MRQALEGWKAGVMIGRKLINNFCYADDTTLVAQNENELIELLNRVEIEKCSLIAKKEIWSLIGSQTTDRYSILKKGTNYLGTVLIEDEGSGYNMQRIISIAKKGL